MSELEPVRISRLRKIGISPAHFHVPEDPKDDEQTPSLELGSMLHAVVLQGAQIVECPMRRDSRTKSYQEFCAENTGKLIATKSQARHVRGMVEALATDPVAPRLLRGVFEETLLWDWMGRACRGTPDIRAEEFITELKTTRCAEPRWFQREADKRGYHQQLAWYEHGTMLVHGGLFRELWVVAVESAPPYAVTCHKITEQRWQDAKKSIRLWFERMLQCEAAGHWPAYTDAPLEWGPNEEWKGREPVADIDPEALA